jgi:S-layer protein
VPATYAPKAFTLTTGADTLTGDKGNDSFSATASTFSALDAIDGAGGVNTMTITDAAGVMNTTLPAGVSVKNIQNMVVNTSGALGTVTAAPTTAVAQVNTYVFGAPNKGDTLVVNYGSQLSTATAGAATATDAGAAFVAAVNAAAGRVIAVNAAGTVTVTAPTAGTALPAITFGAATTAASVPTVAFTTANVVGVAGVTGAAYDVSGITSLTSFVNTAIGNVNLKAATTTDVTVTDAASTTSLTVSGGKAVTATVSGTAGAVTIDGSAGAVTVTQGTSGNVAIGGGTKVTGSVSITDTAQGAGTIAVDGGTTVNVTSTATNPAGATGTITVGAANAPTDAVSITSNLTNKAAAASNTTGGAIAVTGGTTVNVTETAAQGVMATAGTNSTVVQGAVGVTGSKSITTAVTVNQAPTVTAVSTVLGVTGVNEVDTVQFAALLGGNTVNVAGVTLTAPAAGLSAKQVAASFANLAAGQLTGFSSGAVSGGTAADTVTFTATSAVTGGQITVIGVGNKVAPVIAGVTAVTAKGTGGITTAGVTIADPLQTSGVANTIATVSLTNNGTATIASDALTKLSLTNTSTAGASGTVGITNATATALDLTVNGGTKGLGAVATGPTYTTLTVHTAGTDTAVNVTAAGVTALKIDGTNALDLSGSAFVALKTVSATGAVGVKADFTGPTVTGVDMSGSTGTNTISIDPSAATYAGGSGNDTLTIAVVPTKAISGGNGSDTLVLNMTAAAFSTPSLNANITGFETLGLGTAADGSYDATGFTGLTQGAVANAVTYTNVAAGAGLTITASPTQNTTYTLKDATGANDNLSLMLKGAGAINGGTVTAAGIESISIMATDTTASVKAGATVDFVTVGATSATSMTVTGNTTLNLTNTGNTKLVSVDASGMTGGLIYTTAGTAAEVVKGGATTNLLNAGAGTVGDTLIGGAGADTLTANKGLDTLTGGLGADTFVIPVGTSVNVYSTITDATAGDTLQLVNKAVETFNSTKVVLANTAVFQDYANAIVAAAGDASTNGAIGWFQFAGDTFVVESMHNGVTTPSFVNGTDLIVKLTGVVDLSNAVLTNVGGAPQILFH